MSDARYKMLRELNKRKMKVEREYTKGAAETLATPVKSFADEAAAQGQKMRKGGSQIGTGIYEAQQGNYTEALKQAGSGVLNVGAGTVNAAISPVTGMLSALVPDLGVTDYLIENYGDDPRVQEVVKLAQENPMAAEALMNTLDLAGVKGSGKVLKRGFNAFAENTPTKIEGFYTSPNPISKAWATAKAAVPNVGKAIKQGFVPSEQARRRVLGTGRGRTDEYIRAVENDPNLARGTMGASGFMNSQMSNMIGPNRNAVVGNSPEIEKYISDWFDLGETQRLATSLDPSGEMPESVVRAAVNHVQNGPHGASTKPGETSVVIRRPDTGEALAAEAVGTATTSNSMLVTLQNSQILNKASAAMGTDTGPEYYKQVLRVANHATPFNIRAAVANGDLPSGYWTLGTNKKGEKLNTVGKTDLQKDYWGIKLKEAKRDKWLADNPGKTNKSLELTENQKKVLAFFDEAPDVRMTDRGDGIFTFSSSHASSAQDLGGVNDWIALDTSKNKVYSMISDGHDMFGMNPADGNGLINVLPIQEFDVGKPKKFGPGRSIDTSQSVSRIEELTGIKKKSGESIDDYYARVGTQPRKRENVAEVEKRTGIPRNKGEKATDYYERIGVQPMKQENILDVAERLGIPYEPGETDSQFLARVFRDYQAVPEIQDYLRVANNLAGTGMLASQLNTEEPEE